MLTYLGTTLPRFASPAARPLVLQCALHADTRGHVRPRAALLRGMRLCGHRELRQQLDHADWLELPSFNSAPMRLRLLDTMVLDQHPGRALTPHR